MTTTSPVETTSVLIDSLWQARNAEEALAGLLASTRPLASEDDYHQLLTEEANNARQRLDDIDDQLAVLGQQPGPLAATVMAVRHLAGDTLQMSVAAVTGGLGLLRREPIEPTLVEAARAQIASAAFTGATYRALAETARVSGDNATAELATDCRTAVDGLLDRLDELLPALVTDACGAVSSRPTY